MKDRRLSSENFVYADSHDGSCNVNFTVLDAGKSMQKLNLETLIINKFSVVLLIRKLLFLNLKGFGRKISFWYMVITSYSK